MPTQSAENASAVAVADRSASSLVPVRELLSTADVVRRLREAGVPRCAASVRTAARAGELESVAVTGRGERLHTLAAVQTYCEMLRKQPSVLAAARRRSLRER
jgi:hypothetical protein